MILSGMMIIDTKPDVHIWYEDWKHYGIEINKYLILFLMKFLKMEKYSSSVELF